MTREPSFSGGLAVAARASARAFALAFTPALAAAVVGTFAALFAVVASLATAPSAEAGPRSLGPSASLQSQLTELARQALTG